MYLANHLDLHCIIKFEGEGYRCWATSINVTSDCKLGCVGLYSIWKKLYEYPIEVHNYGKTLFKTFVEIG